MDAWKHVAGIAGEQAGRSITFETASFNDYWTKLTSQAASGGSADIVSLQSLRAPQFADLFVLLDDRLSAMGVDGSAFDASIYDGLTVPMELEEAARIDGAGHWRILRSVIAPIAAPAFAVLAVLTSITYWNSFLWPLIISQDASTTTVPLGLDLFLGHNGQQWQLLMAAATISMAPTALLVVVLQRWLVRGIALSGLGGR